MATEGTPLVGSYLATCCSATALVNGSEAAAKLRTATIAGVSPGGSIDAAIGTVGAARPRRGAGGACTHFSCADDALCLAGLSHTPPKCLAGVAGVSQELPIAAVSRVMSRLVGHVSGVLYRGGLAGD